MFIVSLSIPILVKDRCKKRSFDDTNFSGSNGSFATFREFHGFEVTSKVKKGVRGVKGGG